MHLDTLVIRSGANPLIPIIAVAEVRIYPINPTWAVQIYARVMLWSVSILSLAREIAWQNDAMQILSTRWH